MKTVFKKIFFIILLFIILITSSGCTHSFGVEELAYVIAIGLDTSEDDDLELTLQFATSGNSSDSSGEGSSSSGSSKQSTKSTISSVKCKTIDSGITLINSHISKKINLSHCKEIIISEDLAKKGIINYLDTLVTNPELSNSAEIVVSKCTAKKYIEKVNPVFEGLLSEYYSASLKTNTYTAYSTNMNLSTFYCLLKDSYFEPYASLGNITEDADSNSSSNSQITDSINGNYIAGNYDIDDKNPIQTIGFVAFKDDKLVGEFTGLDCVCFSIINNTLEECNLSIPHPFYENKYMDLYVTSSKKTKCKIDTSSDYPIIHLDIYLTGFGQSVDEAISYGDEENIEKIKQSAENYTQQSILNFLNKTSTEYNSDICGFGRYAVKNCLTMEQWADYNWLDNYKNVVFDVNVSFNIKAGRVFSET